MGRVTPCTKAELSFFRDENILLVASSIQLQANDIAPQHLFTAVLDLVTIMSDVATAGGDPAPSTAELQQKLEHLKASATQQYSLKNYAAAAEHYSEAAEVQDAINGEMSPENADLLYQYGRCLYHVGVGKSDVLGGKVAGSGGAEPKRKKRKVQQTEAGSSKAGASAVSDALKEGEEKLAEEVVEAAVEEKEGGKMEEKAASSKPFFQITGDENFTDSEEDDDDAEEGEGEAEEEDDDFAIAYEILDIARVLLRRKLESLPSDQAEAARTIKERLADTHDLQAEIKLENEQFADAVTDAQECLNLKLELYPQESGMVAEAHYKLAIALDFASLPTAPADEDLPEAQVKAKEEPKVDEELRKRAAEEMEKAILSCTLRLQKEETKHSKETAAGEKEALKRNLADIKSLIQEMKNRLIDLRNPAPAAELHTTNAPEGADPLRGILGAMLGESKAEQSKRLQEATAQANDLSGMIRKKKGKGEDVIEGKGKRKAEDGGEAANGSGNGKKVKFEGES